MSKNKRMPKISRRDSRERATQILFSLDFNTVESIPEYLKEYEQEIYKSLSRDTYLLEILNGVLRNIEEIDALIDERLDFSVKSLGKVVLSVLRVAVFEMKINGLAPSIAISEAIQVVKKYGSTEDSAFMNGVLDNIALKEG